MKHSRADRAHQKHGAGRGGEAGKAKGLLFAYRAEREQIVDGPCSYGIAGQGGEYRAKSARARNAEGFSGKRGELSRRSLKGSLAGQDRCQKQKGQGCRHYAYRKERGTLQHQTRVSGGEGEEARHDECDGYSRNVREEFFCLLHSSKYASINSIMNIW